MDSRYIFVYVYLILLYIIATAAFYIIMQVDKKTFYIYTFLKCFFLVLFILWVHKNLSNRLKKILKLDIDEKEKDEDFFMKQLNKLFS
jgi:hypothetical protein